MEHWYVYYKVPVTDTAAVANRVRAMFNALGENGARGRLLQRADPENAEVTLMEVYEPVMDAGAFALALDNAVRASGLAASVIARRRVERFKDL
jgi:hypothetical protein